MLAPLLAHLVQVALVDAVLIMTAIIATLAIAEHAIKAPTNVNLIII